MFAEFVQSVLARLPSSSQTDPQETSPAAIFGDHLVDMIWAVDTQLDELLNEARVASSASQEQGKKEVAALLAKAKKAQTNAENDKHRIPVIVKKLLVCYSSTVATAHNTHTPPL
jgi:THO complex subunit 2